MFVFFSNYKGTQIFLVKVCLVYVQDHMHQLNNLKVISSRLSWKDVRPVSFKAWS